MKWIFVALFLIASSWMYAQQDNTEAKDDINKGLNTRKERKSGYSLVALPSLSYNSDLGFQYGAYGTLYYYGKGEKSIYPSYKHALSFDLSATTNGGKMSQLYYSGNDVFSLPIKIAVDVCYQEDKRYQFYGFNGREALYHPEYSDTNSRDFISENYYRQDRSLFNVRLDFQGKIGREGINWFVGFAYYNYLLASADAEKGTLFDKYLVENVIPSNEKKGARNVIELGLVYDTRDQESNPMKGAWTELLLVSTSRLIGNKEQSFSKISFTYRKYFTLVPSKLSLAGRFATQFTVGSRQAPSYMEPLQFNTFSAITVEGLGGYKTLRGILPNQVVGAGVAYSNVSLRWKFLKFQRWKQSFYCATNAFMDMGTVIQKHQINYAQSDIIPQNDQLHVALGGGVHIAMNENFVLYFNFAKSTNKNDGAQVATYFSTSWLF